MTAFPLFLVLTLTTLGFATLSISMDRHAKQVFGHTPQQRLRVLRATCGWGTLVLALWPAIYTYGVSIGVSVWFGLMAIVATAIGLVLSYHPRLLRAVVAAAAVLTIIALAAVII